MVTRGARVEIGAFSGVGFKNAANGDLARIVSAGIIVAAVQRLPRLTIPIGTDVAHSTIVAIVASRGVGRVCTCVLGMAKIIGARIAVIAIQHHSTGALALLTLLANRTRIAIFTGVPFVGCALATLTGHRVASRLQTELVGTSWSRTLHHRPHIYHTLVGNLSKVAHQSPIANVTIFEFAAVSVHQATAINRRSDAVTLLTDIPQAARIQIVAV